MGSLEPVEIAKAGFIKNTIKLVLMMTYNQRFEVYLNELLVSNDTDIADATRKYKNLENHLRDVQYAFTAIQDSM